MKALRWRAPVLAALVILTVAGPAGPASAHDQLLSSTPTPGERLEAAPGEVSLEFGGEVLAIGAVVIVADASGRNWAAGEPVLEGPFVTVALPDGLPAAGYEVRWRVVSQDGHPISGLIPFTVGDGEAFSSVTSAPTAQPAEASAPQDTSGEAAAIGRIALIGGIGAAVAVAVFALIEILRRRSLRAADTAPSKGTTPE